MGILRYLEGLLAPPRGGPSRTVHSRAPDESSDGDALADSTPSAFSGPAMPAGFDEGLRSLIERKKAGNEPLIAGSVALIGLDDIKSTLGSRWEMARGRVLNLAQAEIRKRLSDGDIMQSEEGGRFAICFASPNQKDAEEKASRISREVKQTLLRDMPEFSSSLEVRKYVADIPIDELGDDTAAFADRLHGIMARIRVEIDSDRLHYRKSLLRRFQIFYAPVWNPRTKRIVSNRSVVDLTDGFSTLSQFQAVADPDQMADMLADLDCMVLTRSVEALHSVRQTQPGASVIVPVGFQTLAAERSYAEFNGLLETVPEAYRPYLVIEITGIPASITAERLLQVLETIGGRTRRSLIQLNGNPKLIDVLDTHVVWGIAWNLTGWDRHGSAQPTTTQALVKLARDRRLISIAHGANSISHALAAVKFGFDCVDGTAIHLSVDAPKAPATLRPVTYPRTRRKT